MADAGGARGVTGWEGSDHARDPDHASPGDRHRRRDDLALAAAVAAQSEATEPTCALVSADEVATIVGAPLPLNENSSGYYCSLGGDSALTISILPETELEPMKADFSGGGEDVTVAGHPAWWQESSGKLPRFGERFRPVPERLVHRGRPPISSRARRSLAELIVQRVPPAADPDVAARLKTLIPATIGSEALDVSVIPGGRRQRHREPAGDAGRPRLPAAPGKSSVDFWSAAGTGELGQQAPSWRRCGPGMRRRC